MFSVVTPENDKTHAIQISCAMRKNRTFPVFGIEHFYTLVVHLITITSRKFYGNQTQRLAAIR
jgi:hypothetical protein